MLHYGDHDGKSQTSAAVDLEHYPEPEAESQLQKTPERHEIEILAYQLWEQRGCPVDSSERDWLEAEAQLTAGHLPPESRILVDQAGSVQR